MVASSSSQVVCPECGQSFSARGLSGHRRQRHGLSPAAALPRAPERGNDALSAILDALTMLQESVARLERQFASRDGVVNAVETQAEEIASLEHELSSLVLCIMELRRGGLATTNLRAPASEREQRACLELARMRREQARIVYRLEELREGCANDNRFLI